MKEHFPMIPFGLYRDDGCGCHRRISGPTLEKHKKGIVKLFKENGLDITIETGLKSIDFLDVTFNLSEDSYKPYKKPNSELLYVNKQSNHPSTVLKHIPNSVNQRLNRISSNKTLFEESKAEYERALKTSGYNETLDYVDKSNENNNKRKRKRNIVWYNPPFNKSLKTDFGRKFLHLLDKHFPRDHILHKIINRNNVKLSYSTTKNMKRVIQSHNSKILNKQMISDSKCCSCPKNKKSDCPLDNKCLSKSIIYKATVEKSGKFYVGVTESEFKKRLAKHKHSFKYESDKNSTTLSKHVWDIKDTPAPKIKWEIVRQSSQRKPGDKECQLCLDEKLEILKNNRDPNCLNKRSELAQRCIIFHRSKHKLANL